MNEPTRFLLPGIARGKCRTVARGIRACQVWCDRIGYTIVVLTSIVILPALGGAATPAGASRMAHGFSYTHDEVPEVPWSIHVIKVERSHPDLELHSALARGDRFGLTTLREHVKQVPAATGRPVAALNGDYYRNRGPYAGDPKGLQIVRGELVSAPCDWTCFWIDAAGNPHLTNVISRFEVTWPDGQKTPFGLNEERTPNAAVLYTTAVGASTYTSGGRDLVLEREGTNSWLPLRAGQTYVARVKEFREGGNAPLTNDTLVLSLGRQLLLRVPEVKPGAVLRIATSTLPSLAGVTMAIGGGPALVRNGQILTRSEANVRHPRSAVGWNRQYFFLVEVDGRQRNLSVGMTFRELSDYLVKLGCQEAMSLDGGGSATCWYYGNVMNNPSEGRERGMGNALVLIQKK